MANYSIDVVLIEYEEIWVAQCLQYDIGAQAKNLQDVVYELNRSLVGHIIISQEKDVEPFSNLEIAPTKYWEMWKGASVKIAVEDEARFRMPEALAHFPRPKFSFKAAHAAA